MKITWKYVIKRLPSYATLSNLLKTYFQCFVPGGLISNVVLYYEQVNTIYQIISVYAFMKFVS